MKDVCDGSLLVNVNVCLLFFLYIKCKTSKQFNISFIFILRNFLSESNWVRIRVSEP